MDFFVINGISTPYTDITPSYDLSSDHSPIIAIIGTTLLNRNPLPRLHNPKTNWDTYRQIIQDNTKLAVRLQSPDDIERETQDFINLIQQAAREATPRIKMKNESHHISCEIKKLIAQKRRARSIWQRTHTPNSKTRYNQLSNELKSKLRETRNNSFTQYVSNLSRYDNSIWKPIKSRNKPTTSTPPLRKNTNPPGPWAKNDQEKAELFAEHLTEVFTPLNNNRDLNVDQILNLPI